MVIPSPVWLRTKDPLFSLSPQQKTKSYKEKHKKKRKEQKGRKKEKEQQENEVSDNKGSRETSIRVPWDNQDKKEPAHGRQRGCGSEEQ